MKKIKTLAVKSVAVVSLFVILLSFAFVQKSSAASFLNFKNAVTTINSYNIDLTTWGFNNPLVWTSEIQYNILRSGSIRGAVGDDIHVLNGANSYRGFRLPGSSITFYENIEFSMFRGDTYGGAFYLSGSQSKISFHGNTTNFKNNFVVNTVGGAGAFGGAIYAGSDGIVLFDGGIVNFLNNTAYDNAAYDSNPTHADGGAIYAHGSSISFNNMMINFTSNTAHAVNNIGRGGAIFATYAAYNQSLISFNNSTVTFAYNNAKSNGSAIYVMSGSTITFNNSKVIFAPNGNGTIAMIQIDGSLIGQQIVFNGGSLIFTSHTSTNIKLIQVNSNYFSGVISFKPKTIGFEYSSGVRITSFVFKSNIAYSLLIDRSSDIKFNIEGTGNFATSGAFITMNAKSLSFSSSVIMTNNIATSSGGVFALSNRSSITFKAIEKDMLFSGNKANSINNDIFMTGWSSVVFNVGNSRLISMDGGIKGTSDTFIRKTGTGDLVFESQSVMDFRGKFIVDAGKVKVLSNLPANIAISALQVNANGIYSMNGENRLQNITSVSNGLISGTLEIEIDFLNNWADLIVTSGTKLTIAAGSSLDIKPYGDTIVGTEITILSVSNGAVIDGVFTNYDAAKYSLIYDPLFTFVKVKLLNGVPIVGWNSFVSLYKTASGVLALDTDTTASGGDNAFASPTSGDNFTIDGQYNDINSNNIADLGFALTATSMTFKNIIIKSFYKTSGDGAAIYNGVNSSVTITGSVIFASNTANSGNGGAIYNAGTLNLSAISGSSIIFENNKAFSGGHDIYSEVGSYINISGAGDVIISSGISGGGLISKTNGILFLNGDNIGFNGIFKQSAGKTIINDKYFIGVSSISGGTLELNDEGILGGAIIDLYNSGTLEIISDRDLIFAGGSLSGNGNINKTETSTGSFVLNGDNRVFSGKFTQKAGTTTINGEYFTGISSIAAGKIELANVGNISAGTIGIYDSAVFDITKGDADVIFAGNIIGNGAINKTAASITELILSGDNSGFTGIFTQDAGTTTISGTYFSGTSNIMAGKLKLENGGDLGSGTINLDVNGTLEIASNADLTFASGQIIGTGKFIQSGAGTTKANGAYFTGISSITAGTLELADGANVNGGTIGIWDNGKLNITADSDLIFNANIIGEGNGINKSGIGDLVFGSGAVIDYAGTFDISGGAVDASGIPTGTDIKFGILDIKTGAEYSMAGGGMQTTIIGSGTISGTLDIEVDFSFLTATADKITTNLTTITIRPNSILNIHFTGNQVGSEAVIFDTVGAWIDFQKTSSLGSTNTYAIIYSSTTQEVKVKYGSTFWNVFAYGYQGAWQDISLTNDITAVASDTPIFNTSGNNFTIDGQNHTLNADNITTALGFTLNNKIVEFKDLSFKNFYSTTDGSVMAINGGQITIKAGSWDVLFEGNAESDISITDAILILNADAKTITMSSGIKGGGGTINKIGSGDLVFGSNAKLDYKGDFNIQAGEVKMPIPTITISTLTIGAGAKLSLVDSVFSQHLLYVGSATISGIFNLGLDLSALVASATVTNAADMIISTGAITISSGSKLNITAFAPFVSTGAVVIMQSGVVIIGSTNFSGYNTANYAIDGNSGNSLILRLLTNPTLPITAMNSDKFFANALSLAAKSHGLDDIYNRLDVGAQQQGNAWVGLYGSGKSIDDFSVNSFGGAFGVDLYKNQNLMGGLFVRYGSNDIKEKENKGTMGEIEFGLYGGLFEIKNSPINVKANLSMGIQSYSMKDEDIDFDGKSVKGGFEVEYVAPLTPTTKIRPFIGFQGGLAMNDDVKGSQATIKSDSLLRAETKLGVGISGKLGAMQNFNWFGRLYGIFLVSGDEPKYKVKYNSGNESEVIGAKEGSIQGAISLGGEYQISPTISIFANAGADFGIGFGWIGGVGANYKF